MKPYDDKTLAELSQMPLSEEVFERILGVLERAQGKKMHAQLPPPRKTRRG